MKHEEKKFIRGPGGKPFEPSVTEIIHQMREERDEQIMQACFPQDEEQSMPKIICVDANFIVCLLSAPPNAVSYSNLWRQWKSAGSQIIAPMIY